MISDTVYTKIKGCLEGAGFCVMREYVGDIRSRPLGASRYTAFVSVKQTELSELTVSGDSPQCSAAVTLRIRALGAKAGFFDAEKLITMTENAAAAIFFSSDIIVKKLVCGEPQKNIPTGRLEQTVELTALTTIETEEDE